MFITSEVLREGEDLRGRKENSLRSTSNSSVYKTYIAPFALLSAVKRAWLSTSFHLRSHLYCSKPFYYIDTIKYPLHSVTLRHTSLELVLEVVRHGTPRFIRNGIKNWRGLGRAYKFYKVLIGISDAQITGTKSPS